MRSNKSVKIFIELFDNILNGNKADSLQAARAVRKLLYSNYGNGGKYEDIALIVRNAPDEYKNITEEWRAENFVIAVSVLYYLHDKNSQPDFLFFWLLHLLRHQNGNIRYAATRMLENELGPLTVHLRCPGNKFRHCLIPEQANIILFKLFKDLNNLLADLWQPAYKKYKYISSLPTGPYKTIQMILSRMEDDCGEVYMRQLQNLLSNLSTD